MAILKGKFLQKKEATNVYIAVTRIKLPKPVLDHIAEAFKQNVGDMQQFQGFLGFELWRNDDTLEAVSRWETREAVEAYTKSDLFRKHHPQGATGGQGSAEIVAFEGEVLL